VAEPTDISATLRMAAALHGRERDQLLRALARLIVEREMEDERIANARDMARGGRGGGRRR
jgi:hypothetical protein